MAHITDPTASGQPSPLPAPKPPTPYPDSPLTPHASGKWQKKIGGRIYYFGNWGRVKGGVLTAEPNDGEWAKALKLYQEQAAALHAGRRPRRLATGGPVAGEPDPLTVVELCNRFLTAKKRKLDAREIGARMFADYKAITD